ncbi:TonB-dependent receptor [Christiangramia salexigens]|uniref:TonB-dependent receptor n=1 Tax=Christiangramia salexigens TaxID=1913577 RepID=A0A1L3J740_9FLAO|nr:carboxypeptidase-like regulatory domain-containing protein [Christiangramia salexigens]APG60914.1 TonB-dependent receptor [Christiangramia salexigens]
MRKLLLLAMLLASATIFAQGTVTGTVMDSDMNGPLPGATVMVPGTNVGTTTDFDGKFSLKVDRASGKIEVSFVGYESKTLNFAVPTGGTQDLGEIVLSPDADALDEIVITTFSLAIDRKTPVAVSNISAAEIETKIGNQEFPEVLKSTPGVYANKAGGGFGDAELRMRGFEGENIAVMINGVPVNDMENGRVYWSNWAGLSDVTKRMQTQRGLGAAKVAVPSIGGTVNIVTKSTDAKKGGNIYAATGNDGYTKFGATVSTGLSENGLAATVSASKTTGDGYVNGTEFTGYSYFVNVAKKLGEDHELSFTAFGAPQRHGQRQNRHLIETYRESESGIKFNSDWGYLDGQVTHIEDNFYHKPQMSLNHYWDINEKTQLSTALYASFGTGGGGGWAGTNKFGLDSKYRDGYLQPVNLDLIVDENIERGAQGSETILRASRNDHNWYGGLSTLSTDLTDDIELLAGVDLRYYKGKHFQEVTDLLGGQYYYDDSNENDPVNLAQVGDKISYYNDGIVLWEGGFLQAEYAKNDLDVFISVAASNTSYKRIDYFNYLDSDPNQETDFYNFFGYSAKGGANYNFSNTSGVFANIGYFEKAPFFDAVFLNFVNDVNPDAENQKIFSTELGYTFRNSVLSANFNAYRTVWSDRSLIYSYNNPDGSLGVANILGVAALHQGLEFDFEYRPIDKLSITGFASLGDYTWKDDVTGVQIFDEEQELVEEINLYIGDTKVGGTPQTTAGLGFDYEFLADMRLRANYNYFADFYSDFDPVSRTSPDTPEVWELPDFGTLDVGLTYKFAVAGFDTTLNANVYNLTNTEYIANAQNGLGNNARTARVWYGFERTYTVGAKLNF